MINSGNDGAQGARVAVVNPTTKQPGNNTFEMKTMKLTTILTALVASGFFCGTAASGTAREETEKADGSNAKREAHARIGKAEAEKTALAEAPGGKVKTAELEEENGRWVWSFDIATPGTEDITEVVVDARTGTVVSVGKETPDTQMKEKKAERKETRNRDKEGHEEDHD